MVGKSVCPPFISALKSYLPVHRLTSRVMDPIKALGRMGLIGGFVNNFDGEPHLAESFTVPD
jgi:hypothetical protein